MEQHEYITDLIKKLKELQDYVDENKFANFSKVEHDLALEKIRHLYDMILSMKFKDEKSDSSKNELENTKKEGPKNISNTVIEEAIHESESDPGEIATDEILIEDKKPINHPVETKEEELSVGLFSDSISDIDESKPETIDKHDLLDLEETIADKMQKDKIESLKDAIGINDKFYFINELFEGSLNDYNEAIERLDEVTNNEETISSLDEYAETYHWNKNTEAYKKLRQFLLRK